ncbi:hypothetical protein C8R45DRAFT_933795 [Mycena sanguinolenta]|nr:hypothetical protein C8R45DRAFT_933795 [Mycena sanguinolenta]
MPCAEFLPLSSRFKSPFKFQYTVQAARASKRYNGQEWLAQDLTGPLQAACRMTGYVRLSQDTLNVGKIQIPVYQLSLPQLLGATTRCFPRLFMLHGDEAYRPVLPANIVKRCKFVPEYILTAADWKFNFWKGQSYALEIYMPLFPGNQFIAHPHKVWAND